MEREIIHVAFAYMNTQKIIIPSEEGQKMAQCLYLKLSYQHAFTHTLLCLFTPLPALFAFFLSVTLYLFFFYLLYMMESDGGWL